MSDQLGKYLGLPPMGAIDDAEIVEEKTVAKPLSQRASSLSDKLSVNIAKEPSLPTIPMTHIEQADKDYEYARENMYSVIEKGTTALEELLGVATQSQHPRAYEVLATTMKTLIDANKELVALSKNKVEEEKLNDDTQQAPSKGVTNNNLFVGTTHDLLKVLAGMRNNNGQQSD
jgi:hypothetical protein